MISYRDYTLRVYRFQNKGFRMFSNNKGNFIEKRRILPLQESLEEWPIDDFEKDSRKVFLRTILKLNTKSFQFHEFLVNLPNSC